jgi:hypothetical protein
MPELIPDIHVLSAASQGVDGRDETGHDDAGTIVSQDAQLKRDLFATQRARSQLDDLDRHIRQALELA